jgi:putative spermidine/putrescine transport system ATP-binding protein
LPYIELEGISKSYDGSTKAVGNLNLSVEKGEFITFLGPSGSGKTTTLMMLAGFEVPSAGRIRVAGKDITALQSWKRNIGVVFQNYALFPHMTVQRNIEFPLRMRKLPKEEIKAKSHNALQLVNLAALGKRYPRELSGGQQQRVALARGLVFQPDLLLLDEPLGALDKNLREQMQIELKRIHRELGMTMIYVTHDQSEAMAMSDRVVLFRAGDIEQIGTPLDLYDRPQTKFVAEFIGDSNIVALDAVDQHDGRVKAQGLGEFFVDRFSSSASAERTLLVRPEDVSVQLAPECPDRARVNIFAFKIESVVHFGSDTLLIGQLNDRLPFRVRVPASAGRGLPESGLVHVFWPSSAGFVV